MSRRNSTAQAIQAYRERMGSPKSQKMKLEERGLDETGFFRGLRHAKDNHDLLTLAVVVVIAFLALVFMR